MKELTIGDIIKYQINKKSILPEKLTEGLCTTTSLKRLINGDTRQSFFLVERKLHMQYVLETRGGLYSQRVMESTKKPWNFITRLLRL